MGPRRMTTQVVACLIPARAWFQLNDQVVQPGLEELLGKGYSGGYASLNTSKQNKRTLKAKQPCLFSFCNYEMIKPVLRLSFLGRAGQRGHECFSHNPPTRPLMVSASFALFRRGVGWSFKVGPLHFQFSVTFLPTGNLC